jgi:hypothetical protein
MIEVLLPVGKTLETVHHRAIEAVRLSLYELIGISQRSRYTTNRVCHDHDDQKEIELPHRTGGPPFDAFDGMSSKEEVSLGRLDWYSQFLGLGEMRHVVDTMRDLPQ